MVIKAFLVFLIVFLVHNASSKTVKMKSLTESHGQEIIEIKNPLKDLPELEEEPSGENFENFKITTTTIQPITKKDTRRLGASTKEPPKDAAQEEDEKRIEKELADLYKDNVDYKAESAEISPSGENLQKLDSKTTPKTSRAGPATLKIAAAVDKPIARANDFQFQPNINNKADVERFRTSVDDITCDKKYTTVKLRHEKPSSLQADAATALNSPLFGILSAIILNLLFVHKLCINL